MAQWVRTTIILGMFFLTAVFIAVCLIRGADIPLPIWSVPGATYALLSNGKLPSIRIGKPDDPKGDEQ